MKKISLVAFAACILCLSSVAPAQPGPSDGFIGIFGDAAGTQCCFLNPGSKVMYLIAVTAGATGDGITGAEFRVEVSDGTNYAYIYTAPAGAIALGNPMDLTLDPDDAGFNIAFPACRPETTPMPGDHVSLGTIRAINFGTGGECTMLVKRKIPSSNPNYLCPLFTKCDIPVYTTVCTTLQEGDPLLHGAEPVGFKALMNPASCTGVTCGYVPARLTTWSTVKEMFR